MFPTAQPCYSYKVYHYKKGQIQFTCHSILLFLLLTQPPFFFSLLDCLVAFVFASLLNPLSVGLQHKAQCLSMCFVFIDIADFSRGSSYTEILYQLNVWKFKFSMKNPDYAHKWEMFIKRNTNQWTIVLFVANTRGNFFVLNSIDMIFS